MAKSFILSLLAEVESRTQGSRPRPRTQKKIRSQSQRQPFRGQTLSRPRTGMLEAKAKNQGHQRKCSPKKKKRSSQKFFWRSPKNRSSQKFFKRSPQKNVFQKIFQALHEILTLQKIVLSSSRGQANFREFEDLRPRGQGQGLDLRGQGQGLQNKSSRTKGGHRYFKSKSVPVLCTCP